MHANPSDSELKALLTRAKTIAVVGASSNPERASHGVMLRLQRAGYKIIPVNPTEREIVGERSRAKLADITEHVDIVNVFRRAELTPPIADEAIAIGADCLWLQLGIENEETAARAKAGGLVVVMDSCIAVVHALLGVPRKNP